MTVKRCIGKQAKVSMGCKAIYITTWKKMVSKFIKFSFSVVIFTSQSFNFKEVIILMSFTTQCLWIATFGSNSLFGFRGSYFNHRLKNEDQILKHLIDKFVAERKSQNLLKQSHHTDKYLIFYNMNNVFLLPLKPDIYYHKILSVFLMLKHKQRCQSSLVVQ